jgi:Ran GTPase-activating protein (RanGAP) involved in mRNA processing and transport
MALSKLSGDEQGIVFVQLCNVLDPRLAVTLSSINNELRTATQEGRQQLRADHEAAAALCLKMGLRSCKELREAKMIDWYYRSLTADELALLGTLGSVLPALETLALMQPAAGPDGMQRLAEGLGAGALPAVTHLNLASMHVGDAGASELAAALGRGALPRLKRLVLDDAAIGDASLVALAPAVRRLPALKHLDLENNPFGDEGLAALVAPPPPAGASPPPTGGLTKLKRLWLSNTQITDAGCAAIAAALDSGALPELETLYLGGIPASLAAIFTIFEARANLRNGESESEHDESGSESEEEEEEDE